MSDRSWTSRLHEQDAATTAASLESTPQLASFAPFPPACETAVHHFPVLLVLAYLNTLGLLACLVACKDCGQSATLAQPETQALESMAVPDHQHQAGRTDATLSHAVAHSGTAR